MLTIGRLPESGSHERDQLPAHHLAATNPIAIGRFEADLFLKGLGIRNHEVASEARLWTYLGALDRSAVPALVAAGESPARARWLRRMTVRCWCSAGSLIAKRLRRKMLRAMAMISRESLATECFGFDPYLQRQRMKRASLTADVQQLSGVIHSQPGLLGKIWHSAKITISGRSFMDDVQWGLFTISEGRTNAEVNLQSARINQICRSEGGSELPDSIPRILAANPFGPVNNMVGADGERWLPVHGLVPHSRSIPCLSELEAVYARHSANLDKFNIETGYLLATISQQVTLIEPVFFWPDSLNALHEHYLETDHLARINRFKRVPNAWEAVSVIKSELIDVFSNAGASHLQLGKAYQYESGLKPEPLNLIRSIKSELDPNHIINPGVLGL